MTRLAFAALLILVGLVIAATDIALANHPTPVTHPAPAPAVTVTRPATCPTLHREWLHAFASYQAGHHGGPTWQQWARWKAACG